MSLAKQRDQIGPSDLVTTPANTPTQRFLRYLEDARTRLNANVDALNNAFGAQYLVAVSSSDLSAERVATDTATISWDFGTAGQAKANIADAELLAIAGLASAADSAPYFTGSGTAALMTVTAAGRALLDDADAAAQRTTLGLGTLATLDAVTDAYTVTNGSTDRAFDADAAAGAISNPPTQAEVEGIRDALLEVADVLGTLISDLKAAGVVG